MFSKAWSRSASVTPLVWENLAIALRTWSASVRGSLRLPGKAYALSGSSLRSAAECVPCSSTGFHVVAMTGGIPCRAGAYPGSDHAGAQRVRDGVRTVAQLQPVRQPVDHVLH